MSSKEFTVQPPGRRVEIGLHKKKEKLKNPKETIKRLLRYIGSKKVSLILILLLCIITTIISVVGTRINGIVVDKYIAVGDISGLFKICMILILMYFISTISTFVQNRLMVDVGQNTSYHIRKDMFEKMQDLPISYYDTHSSGDLMSRLTNDIDNINTTLSQSLTQLISGIISVIGMLIAMLMLNPSLAGDLMSRLTNDIDNINTTLSQSLTQLISGIISVIGMLIAMLMLNPSLALIGLISTPITIFGTRKLMSKTQPLFVKKQKILGELNGYIEEIISGQKAVLLFSQEDHVKEKFKVINKNMTESSILAEAISGCMGPINNFVNNLTYLILAVAGGIFILKGMDITVGVIFTIILYMRNFNQPINQILNISNTLQSALAGAERVFEVMDEESEKDQDDAKDVVNLDGEVQLKDVEFSYNKDKKILNNINLTARKGETVAIVGPTGSGKTTIINLINKFYNIDGGSILIDGKNIDELTMKSLRKSVAIVLQDTYLFTKSVKENLRYANLTATDDEIIKAAKLSNAHHFIMQLEDGYETILEDNGSNLSQGQRQLLAITRAILSNSSILILDEATSSIDTRTEVAIQDAIMKLKENKTTFIIAHRLSTIKNADVIIAIKDGEIIERGNHEELLKLNGFYANLYNSQFKTGLSI